MFSIEDVPCLDCQHGYAGAHRCEIPDYCACDRWRNHTNEGEA